MPRTTTILVSFFALLICKSLFSTATQIEMPVLSHDQVPSSKTNLTPINNFLIYPTPHSFKYFILPFLSPKNVIQIYEHFKIFNPQLDKWLECFEKSTVIDLIGTKTLYYFNQNKPSSLNTILYSENTKIAIIPKVVSPQIKPNETCALLLFNEIFPFQQHQLVSQENVWVARNLNNIFVTLKVNENKFVPIARGNLHKMHLYNVLECIWQAYNLKGLKKFLFAARYFFTIPFLKYFQYISCPLGKFFNKLKESTWRDCTKMNVHNFSELILFRILWIIFCYIHAGLEYQILMFPFHVIGYMACTVFHAYEFNFRIFIASPYIFICTYGVAIFPPNLIHLLINTIQDDLHGIKFLAKDSKRFSSFEIEPKNNMWALPYIFYFIQNSYLPLVLFAILFSWFFKFWIEKW